MCGGRNWRLDSERGFSLDKAMEIWYNDKNENGYRTNTGCFDNRVVIVYFDYVLEIRK